MTHFNKSMDCRDGIRRLAMTENDGATRKMAGAPSVTGNVFSQRRNVGTAAMTEDDRMTRRLDGVSTMTMGFDFKL